MRAGVDGEIRIDSRIDPKGFNEGMKKLGGSMSGVMKVLVTGLKVVAIAVAIVVAAVVLVGVALIALTSVMLRWGEKMVDTLLKSQSVTGDFRNRVLQLKGAFDTLKGTMMALGATLLNALAPIIMRIIAWLIKAINFISMFIASLTGQATVMQYVAGATESAATGAGDLADNTDKAKKAAKGALAAFDELNVLQQHEPAVGGGAGVPVGGPMMVEVPVPADFAKTSWENFKIWFIENIAKPIGEALYEALFPHTEPKEGQKTLFEWIGDAIDWEGIKERFNEFWGPGGTVSQFFAGAAQNFREYWGPGGTVTTWFKETWEKIKLWAEIAWAKIQEIWGKVKEWFKTNVIDPVVNWFRTAWGNIIKFFTDAWATIQLKWSLAKQWFQTTVIDPIKNAFTIALNSIKTKWETTFTGIKTFVKQRINDIIGFLQKLIDGLVKGLNAIIKVVNSIAAVVPGGITIPSLVSPKIPTLAKGAVIPPNAKFAAILGDNKTQNEILAPENLIRQIVQEEVGNIRAEVTINFAGSLSQFVREMKPYIDKENVRIGTSLVKGSV